MDRSRETASGSALLNPSSRPTATGKKVVITTRAIFGATPKPIQRTSSGAMAMVGIVWDATSSGSTARSRFRKRSMALARPKASSVPSSRPSRASSTDTQAWAARFGKSAIKARITSTGEGSM